MADGTQPLEALRRTLAPALVEAARAGKTAAAPGVLYEELGFFVDPERFSRERSQLFHETPLVACLTSELHESGSYRTFDDAGVPILLTRGRDGQVRRS